MDATAFVVIGALVIAVAVAAIKREAQATREALEAMREDADRLTAKVERHIHVATSANVLARHAVVSAERAETNAERCVERVEAGSVVVVLPAGVPKKDRN